MTIKVHHLRPAPGARTAKTRVGRGEGGVFAEAVTGDEGRLDPLLDEDTARGRADGKNCGLRNLRQRELILWTVKTDLAQASRVAVAGKGGIRFGERAAGGRIRVSKLSAHSDLLGALSWKDERDHETAAAAISRSTR